MNINDLFERDLSQYSSYDNVRSISSYIDGSKNSGRKVVFFSKNLSNYKKVSMLAPEIMMVSQYLHADITDVVISYAANYNCSNNINVLKPFSSIGNRITPVAAAARYSLVKKEDIYDYLYIKEDEDILIHQEFEGEFIEPRFLVPTLPMLLVNGGNGMGVGFAQNIYPRDPKQIISYIKKYLSSGKMPTERIKPSLKGYVGDIQFIADPEKGKTQWSFKGKYTKINTYELKISEVLPYDTRESVLTRLDSLVEKRIIKSFKDSSIGDKFDVSVQVQGKFWDEVKDIEKLLGISTTDTENFTCVNEDNCITVFENELDILEKFIQIKLDYTQKRIYNMISKLESKLILANSRAYFIEAVLNKSIVIEKKSKQDIIQQIEKHKQIQRHNDSYDIYLQMPLYSLSLEKIQELEKEVIKLKSEIEVLVSTNSAQMWLKDITALEKKLAE